MNEKFNQTANEKKIQEVNQTYAYNYANIINEVVNKPKELKKWHSFEKIEAQVGNYIISEEGQEKKLSSFCVYNEGAIVELYFADEKDKYVCPEDEYYYDKKIIIDILKKLGIEIIIDEKLITLVFKKNNDLSIISQQEAHFRVLKRIVGSN